MAPFKLTQDYIDILGGMDSSKFTEFRALLKRQFREVRRHAERVITIVELMQTDSKLPCFSSGEQTSQLLRDRFQLGLPVAQADEFVDKLVISSAGKTLSVTYVAPFINADLQRILQAVPSLGYTTPSSAIVRVCYRSSQSISTESNQ